MHQIEIILESIDIEETLANEEIIECYYQTCQQVKFIDIKERNRPLDDLTKEI